MDLSPPHHRKTRRVGPAGFYQVAVKIWASAISKGYSGIVKNPFIASAALRALRSFARCDGCCLTRLIPRRGPRKTDPIGIRPVLLPARKRRRLRDRCQNRSALQSINVCRQRENA